MVDRLYGYQSETSPRELQPEYRSYRTRYPEKSVIVKTYENSKVQRQKNIKIQKQESIKKQNQRNIKTNNEKRIKIQKQESIKTQRQENIKKQKVAKLRKQKKSKTQKPELIIEQQVVAKPKKNIRARAKLVIGIMIGFSILFVVSYRNSIINESFSRKESLKEELNSVQKTNEQLRVSIENSLNLNNVEQEAKERVGMQKLTNSQKIYVNLEKKDYVEAASEQIIMEDEGNIIEKLLNGFTKSI